MFKVDRARLYACALVTATVFAFSSPVAQGAQSYPGEPRTPATASLERPSSGVARSLQNRWGSARGFVGVWIDDDLAVTVVAKSRPEGLPTRLGEVGITFVQARFDLAELKGFAEEIAAVPGVAGVDLDARRGIITAIVTPHFAGSAVPNLPVMPDGISTRIQYEAPPVEEAAEGGAALSGSGCTTGFRFNGNVISTAAHCSNTWGSANGSALTHSSEYCYADIQFATGTTQNTYQGTTVNASGDPTFGDYAWHWGSGSGWSYGYFSSWYYFVPSSGACSGIGVWTMSIVPSGGGSYSYRHAPGDSGGGYVQSNGSGYTARGYHKGGGGTTGYMVPISTANAIGFSVW